MAKTKNTFFSNVIDLFAKRCAGEKKKIREVSVGCLKKRRGGGGQNWNSLTLEIQNVL